MIRANKALWLVLVLLTVGLLGCAQGSGPAAGSARLRDLEVRHAKLEEDYAAALAARDQARKQVTALQQESTALRQQLAHAARERAELRQQLTTRTSERDALQNSLTQFSKDLHALVGRVDAAAGVQTGQPVATEGPTLEPPQSKS